MRHRWTAEAAWLGVIGAIAIACTDGQQANSGFGEPIQVSGQFIPGPLPGSSPAPAETMGDAGPAGIGSLAVTSVLFQNSLIVSGLGGTGVSGLVTHDAVSVGIQLADKGSGYWVVPVQAPDTQAPGQNDFGFSLSLNPDDAPGQAQLRLVAISGDGHPGQQVNAPICILSRIPDNGHACSPKKPVPKAVISLRWDSNFDVDLHVVVPGGRDVNAKTAITSVALDAGPPPPTVGVVDRDSIGNCAVDGWREEDLVFQDAPPHGTYLIYAAPFSACGQVATRFNLDIYEPGPDGNLHTTETTVVGELLANDVTGGTSQGLFVAQKTF